jgi:hypothetical protein
MPTQTNFRGVSSAPVIDIRRFDEVSYHDLQSTLVSENGFKTINFRWFCGYQAAAK